MHVLQIKTAGAWREQTSCKLTVAAAADDDEWN
jgi:hypothetical protein